MTNDHLPLDLLDRAGVRKRFRMAVIAILILAAAIGGVLGLIFGQVTGLVAAGVIGMCIRDSRRRAGRCGWTAPRSFCGRSGAARSICPRLSGSKWS